MFKIDIIAVSRTKKGPLFELIEDYKRRIQWSLTIHEIEAKSTDPQKAQEEENEKILKLINPSAVVVVLDERGEGLKSLDFAKTLEKFKNNGDNHFQFILGGADGLMDPVRNKANILLSFGRQTWPHLLARVMLLEQIYRAQQIMIGHPYHRE
jgi:23S rRNA (pseudouridine1915-N3)-methyltransferase